MTGFKLKVTSKEVVYFSPFYVVLAPTKLRLASNTVNTLVCFTRRRGRPQRSNNFKFSSNEPNKKKVIAQNEFD